MYQEYFAITIPDANRAMIPEKWKSSATQYERYPKQKIKVHSIVGLTVMNLNYLVTNALNSPNDIPKNRDQKASFKKL